LSALDVLLTGVMKDLPQQRSDGSTLRASISRLASQNGRYTYRMITELVVESGWPVRRPRIVSIRRVGRLKVPQRLPEGGRLWFANGSRVRLRPERRNFACFWDFVQGRIDAGRQIKMLTPPSTSTPGPSIESLSTPRTGAFPWAASVPPPPAAEPPPITRATCWRHLCASKRQRTSCWT
jgi:hypothetical protein